MKIYTILAFLSLALLGCNQQGNPLLSAGKEDFKELLTGGLGWGQCADDLYGPSASPEGDATCIGLVQRNAQRKYGWSLNKEDIINPDVKRRFHEVMKNA